MGTWYILVLSAIFIFCLLIKCAVSVTEIKPAWNAYSGCILAFCEECKVFGEWGTVPLLEQSRHITPHYTTLPYALLMSAEKERQPYPKDAGSNTTNTVPKRSHYGTGLAKFQHGVTTLSSAALCSDYESRTRSAA